MRHQKTLLASLVLLVCACAPKNDKVEVTILPTRYVVGSVSSELATPAVDEVVKLKPRDVHIHTCTATPPERVLQFNIELDARMDSNTTMSFTAQGC